MNQEEYHKKMSQLIAKCWADEGFKRKLLADPRATLEAEGAELPSRVAIKAVENSDKVFHLVIPAKPTGNLSDEDLDKVAGGGWWVNLNIRTWTVTYGTSDGNVGMRNYQGPN
jgi:Nitrile hydratase, alpha chain